jgi:hypothetical protein
MLARSVVLQTTIGAEIDLWCCSKDYVTAFDICERSCEELKQKIAVATTKSDAFAEFETLKEKEELCAQNWKELESPEADKLRQLRVVHHMERFKIEQWVCAISQQSCLVG